MEKVLLDLKYRLAFELMPTGYANRVWENRRLAAEEARVMLGRDRRLYKSYAPFCRRLRGQSCGAGQGGNNDYSLRRLARPALPFPAVRLGQHAGLSHMEFSMRSAHEPCLFRVTFQRVVPANAGTHTARTRVLALAQRLFFTFEARGDGSLRSRLCEKWVC
jgi:hypothetical protein